MLKHFKSEIYKFYEFWKSCVNYDGISNLEPSLEDFDFFKRIYVENK